MPTDLERRCLGKRRYSALSDARIVASHRNELTGIALRAYPCSHCLGYHLTKRPLGADGEARAHARG